MVPCRQRRQGRRSSKLRHELQIDDDPASRRPSGESGGSGRPAGGDKSSRSGSAGSELPHSIAIDGLGDLAYDERVQTLTQRGLMAAHPDAVNSTLVIDTAVCDMAPPPPPPHERPLENGEVNRAMDGDTDDGTDGKTDAETDGQTDGKTDGQMDGQTDGKTDVQTDGQVDAQTGGQTDGQMDGKTDGQTDGETDVQTDGQADDQLNGQTDGQTDCQTCGQTSGQTDGQTDSQTAGQLNGQTGGQTDGQTDGQTGGQTDSQMGGQTNEMNGQTEGGIENPAFSDGADTTPSERTAENQMNGGSTNDARDDDVEPNSAPAGVH